MLEYQTYITEDDIQNNSFRKPRSEVFPKSTPVTGNRTVCLLQIESGDRGAASCKHPEAITCAVCAFRQEQGPRILSTREFSMNKAATHAELDATRPQPK